MHRLLGLLTLVLLLSSCGVSKPRSPSPVARVASSGIYSQLLQLPLSGDWKAVDRSEQGEIFFALPSAINRLNHAETETGFVIVHPLTSGDCTTASILAQARISQGEHPNAEDRPKALTVNGGTYGSVWYGFNGVAGGATRPDWQFWCIQSPLHLSDIEIRTHRDDTDSVDFVSKTLIPNWRALQTHIKM